jgi:outer membrane protein OmpA-like peptidoglycan-associated protein
MAAGSAVALAALSAGAVLAQAQQPTREEIIESLRAKQLTRCPRFDPKQGCGVAPVAGIDVEIQFDSGSATLGTAATAWLTDLGAVLIKPETKSVKLLVAGHADAHGGDDYNLRLSQRRAEAVKRVLIARFKLPDTAVIAVGYGKTHPKNPADPFAGENRRVEISAAGDSPAAPPERP